MTQPLLPRQTVSTGGAEGIRPTPAPPSQTPVTVPLYVVTPGPVASAPGTTQLQCPLRSYGQPFPAVPVSGAEGVRSNPAPLPRSPDVLPFAPLLPGLTVPTGGAEGVQSIPASLPQTPAVVPLVAPMSGVLLYAATPADTCPMTSAPTTMQMHYSLTPYNQPLPASKAYTAPTGKWRSANAASDKHAPAWAIDDGGAKDDNPPRHDFSDINNSLHQLLAAMPDDPAAWPAALNALDAPDISTLDYFQWAPQVPAPAALETELRRQQAPSATPKPGTIDPALPSLDPALLPDEDVDFSEWLNGSGYAEAEADCEQWFQRV